MPLSAAIMISLTHIHTLNAFLSTLLLNTQLSQGLYFGFITLSTIGLGDFVFSADGSRGLGIVFTLVGLGLFAETLGA